MNGKETFCTRSRGMAACGTVNKRRYIGSSVRAPRDRAYGREYARVIRIQLNVKRSSRRSNVNTADGNTWYLVCYRWFRRANKNQRIVTGNVEIAVIIISACSMRLAHNFYNWCIRRRDLTIDCHIFLPVNLVKIISSLFSQRERYNQRDDISLSITAIALRSLSIFALFPSR